jgi:hypothetical protein
MIVRVCSAFRALSALTVFGLTASCGGGGAPSGPSPSPTPLPTPTLTAPTLESPDDGEQLNTLRPTLTVLNGVSSQPGARTYEFQISDSEDFSSTIVSAVDGFLNVVTTTGVPEGGDGKTSFTPSADLQPTTRFFWRVRIVQGSGSSPWSETGNFKTRLEGFIRAGELYDPLIHGETVGTRVGTVQFVSGKGARLVNFGSHIRYRLPQTVAAGEFSMEVEGLRSNGPGDKTKVFAMQEGLGDLITNPYRVTVEYRGIKAGPPDVIAWRAIFGSSDTQLDTNEADRAAGVRALNAATVYLWKATWGSGFRLVVLEGGLFGRTIYNRGKSVDADYGGANPHYAFLGAPAGRSGLDSASIPGTIYRNVWLGNRPRPESLGSALQD